MGTATIKRSVDGTGKSITTFVLYDAAAALEEMADGEVLEILTDEFEPFVWDISAWTKATGHGLAASESTAEGHRFLIEKKTQTARDTKLAMVLSSDGLLDLLSPLGFALAAALEGIDVHLYFQGPGVRVLTKRFRPKLPGLSRPFSRFAIAGMNKAGHIPPHDKLRQLHQLGAHIYVCGGSLQPFKVKKEDFIFDDLPIVEYFSFMSVMEEADVQLYV
jgi:predicted peroxiredoxin/TusA-related sulfurtransferase